MKIIGLNVNSGQSAAALSLNGKIVAAAAEERFNRIKHSRSFPRRAIEYCLDMAGLTELSELDAIAVSWNPAINMSHINLSGFTDWRRYDPEWMYIVPNNIMRMVQGGSLEASVTKIDVGIGVPIYYIPHHQSHMAHAIFESPFDQGAVAVVDEYGEYNSVTLGKFSNNTIEVLKQIPYPHSLGVFYAAITEYLGFTPNGDEWKVMGAAAYGDPSKFYEQVSQIIQWDPDRKEWFLEQRHIEHANMKRAGYCTESMERLLNIPKRTSSSPLGQEHKDLAASAQLVFEERLFSLLNSLHEVTEHQNLASSGGCMMNSLANGKILNNTPFENLFIPSSASDNGGAIGSALYLHYVEYKNKFEPETSPTTPYQGPEYTDEDILAVLRASKLSYEQRDDITLYTADKIAEGKIVGWFQGKMEFGERALGARSILADPRNEKMKEQINAAVKFRESFRPFAPSILNDDIKVWSE